LLDARFCQGRRGLKREKHRKRGPGRKAGKVPSRNPPRGGLTVAVFFRELLLRRGGTISEKKPGQRLQSGEKSREERTLDSKNTRRLMKIKNSAPVQSTRAGLHNESLSVKQGKGGFPKRKHESLLLSQRRLIGFFLEAHSQRKRVRTDRPVGKIHFNSRKKKKEETESRSFYLKTRPSQGTVQKSLSSEKAPCGCQNHLRGSDGALSWNAVLGRRSRIKTKKLPK